MLDESCSEQIDIFKEGLMRFEFQAVISPMTGVVSQIVGVGDRYELCGCDSSAVRDTVIEKNDSIYT